MPIRLSTAQNVRGSNTQDWGFSNAPISLACWLSVSYNYVAAYTTRHILRGNADSWNLTYAAGTPKPANVVMTSKLMTGFTPNVPASVTFAWDAVVHYALTVGHDGTSNKIVQYLNGVQVSSEALTASTGTYKGISVGQHTTLDGTGNFDMDDLAAWNRMLTAADVLNLYNKTYTPGNLPSGGAYYYWPLDGADGATVTVSDAGLIATPNSLPLTTTVTGTPKWCTVMGRAIAASGYVGPSGKTLVVLMHRVSDSGRTYATAVPTAPQIRINGGSPVTLSTDGTTLDKSKVHYGTSARPYLAYNLPKYSVTVNAGDTVELLCVDNWATCPEGSPMAATVAITNQVGTEPLPVPATARTMRNGTNQSSPWDYDRMFIPTTNIAPAIVWADAAANAKGIPTVSGTIGKISGAISAATHGHQVPPGRDIAVEFKGGDVVLTTASGNSFTLVSTTSLGGGWTRKIYQWVLNPSRTTTVNDVKCVIQTAPVEDLRMFIQASPGLEYSFDNPPKWHPDVLDRYRNFRVLRSAFWFQCMHHVSDQYSDLAASNNWGKYVRRERTVSSITPVADDATGLAGYYNDAIYDIQVPIVEGTTSTPFNAVTGQPVEWRSGTTSVTTEYGGTCTGDSVSADGRCVIAIAADRFRCVCSTNVRKATYFKGAQQLNTSDTTALRPANGPFTISCWFKVEGDTTTGTIIESANNYRLWFDGSNKKIKFTTYDTVGAKTVESSTALTKRAIYWIHAEYDTAGTTARLRLNDGTAATVAMGATPSTNNASGVYVGSSGGSAYLNGQISGLAIWKRLLTTQERAWLYNPSWWRGYPDIGVGGTDGANLKTNLAAYYHMGQWGTYSGTTLLSITDQHTGGVTLTESSSGATKAANGDHARPAASSGLDWVIGMHVGVTQPPAEFAEFVASIPDCDLWLNIPYMMNAAGVQAMVQDVFSALPRGRKVFLELGNEPWNFYFQTYETYAHIARGMALYGNLETNWYKVHIDHWLVMVDAAKATATAMNRLDDLLPLLSSWFVNSSVTTNYCSYLNTLGRMSELKYLAIAPYLRLQSIFSRNTGLEGSPDWKAITEAGQIYDYANEQLTYGGFDSGTTTKVSDHIQNHRALLDAAGASHVKLAVYESSINHVQSVTSEHITSFLPMYTTCHPRARNFYARHMQLCQDAGIEVYCDFILGHPYYGHYLEYKYNLWSKYASLGQYPGVGDGSDGKYDNRNFMTYDANSEANGDFKLISGLSSPIGKTYIDWGALVPDRPAPDPLVDEEHEDRRRRQWWSYLKRMARSRQLSRRGRRRP